ncbi:hypothetical protein KRP22_011284 [Phytophthora ramorum]|nr:hypothetical protein KRP22_15252 [Phytophthora ramorum]
MSNVSGSRREIGLAQEEGVGVQAVIHLQTECAYLQLTIRQMELQAKYRLLLSNVFCEPQSSAEPSSSPVPVDRTETLAVAVIPTTDSNSSKEATEAADQSDPGEEMSISDASEAVHPARQVYLPRLPRICWGIPQLPLRQLQTPPLCLQRSLTRKSSVQACNDSCG